MDRAGDRPQLVVDCGQERVPMIEAGRQRRPRGVDVAFGLLEIGTRTEHRRPGAHDGGHDRDGKQHAYDAQHVHGRER